MHQGPFIWAWWDFLFYFWSLLPVSCPGIINNSIACYFASPRYNWLLSSISSTVSNLLLWLNTTEVNRMYSNAADITMTALLLNYHDFTITKKKCVQSQCIAVWALSLTQTSMCCQQKRGAKAKMAPPLLWCRRVVARLSPMTPRVQPLEVGTAQLRASERKCDQPRDSGDR